MTNQATEPIKIGHPTELIRVHAWFYPHAHTRAHTEGRQIHNISNAEIHEHFQICISI